MCGIAGILSADGVPEWRPVLERMTESLHHRGPDDCGYYHEGPVFLGHRRLSIIDVAAGHQPMPNEDDSAWIVYNGEVFNHAQLRPVLERAGHRYRTRSDTETILHAWEEYGPGCVEHFRGMFAFAIWDARKQTLFCARDRLGIKPFYYYCDGRVFLFASEIKALLVHPAVRTGFDSDVLPEYLAFGYLSGENTMFHGIRKLMPGHRMQIEVRNLRIEPRVEQYWNPPLDRPDEILDEAGWVAGFRRRLEETVEMRLMSDVPLGVFLSGGLDSSAIAALTQRMTDERVKTFSVGYAERRYSELDHARQAAEHIGSEHHEVKLGMGDFFNSLPRLIWHEDEPIAWPSSVSLYFVAGLASKHVKVVLTGEGSDELYAGYGRYANYLLNLRWLPYYRWLPEELKSWIRGQVDRSSMLPADARRKLKHTFVGLREDITSLLLDNFYSAFSAEETELLLRQPGRPAYESFLRHYNAGGAHTLSPLQRMLYADQKTYLVELLMKQDQMSMACSIESRVPLLDHTFVDFSYRVPAGLKLRGAGKYIVKKAVEDLLPRDIVYREKQGFPTPIREWLRDDRCQSLYDAMLDPGGFVAEHLHLQPLHELFGRYRAGEIDATDRAWRLLNLHIWSEVFIEGRLGPASEAALIPAVAGPMS